MKNTGFNILWSCGPVGHLPSFMAASGDFLPVSSRVHGAKVSRMGLDMLMVSRHLPCGAGGHRLRKETGLGAGSVML